MEGKSEREDDDNGRRFSERSYGYFCRTIPLPSNVDADQIHADCSDGVLEVSMPKTEATRAKTIPIGERQQKTGSSQQKTLQTQKEDLH